MFSGSMPWFSGTHLASDSRSVRSNRHRSQVGRSIFARPHNNRRSVGCCSVLICNQRLGMADGFSADNSGQIFPRRIHPPAHPPAGAAPAGLQVPGPRTAVRRRLWAHRPTLPPTTPPPLRPGLSRRDDPTLPEPARSDRGRGCVYSATDRDPPPSCPMSRSTGNKLAKPSQQFLPTPECISHPRSPS
jgi:hypothetical protein